MKHEEDTLEAAARDVVYELQMLVHTADAFPGGQRLIESVADRNVFLESFLIHARVVDEFLRSTPTRDDVTAEHYLPGWRGRSILTDVERIAIDKQVAHLTAARRDKIKFPVTGIARRLAVEFLDFCEQLDAHDASTWAWFVDAQEAVQDWLPPSDPESTTGTSIDEVYLSGS